MATSNEAGPKVFDVAKPGSAAPDIGSKPMIVGHKTLAKDPMVREVDINNDEKTPPEEEKEAPSTSKKVIAPLADSEKSTEETVVAKADDDGQTRTEVESIENKSVAEPTSSSQDELKNEPLLEADEKIDPSVEKMERDENVRNMVESKKYFVTIHDSQSSSSIKTFIVTFLVALVVGIAAVTVLIDAEIIDIGVTLPFDFL